jgi:hypothetical protein
LGLWLALFRPSQSSSTAFAGSAVKVPINALVAFNFRIVGYKKVIPKRRYGSSDRGAGSRGFHGVIFVSNVEHKSGYATNVQKTPSSSLPQVVDSSRVTRLLDRH